MQRNEIEVTPKITIIPLVSGETLLEYFDVMEQKKPLYIVIVTSEDQPTVFLEKPTEGSASGICRVFFRYDDSVHYIHMISSSFGANPQSFKSWETNFNDLVTILHQVSERKKKQKVAGIRAVTTVLSENIFLDADIFWTSEKEFMV